VAIEAAIGAGGDVAKCIETEFHGRAGNEHVLNKLKSKRGAAISDAPRATSVR
jgi:hypothetical protein